MLTYDAERYDVFSAAVVAFVLFFAHPPFFGSDP